MRQLFFISIPFLPNSLFFQFKNKKLHIRARPYCVVDKNTGILF